MYDRVYEMWRGSTELPNRMIQGGHPENPVGTEPDLGGPLAEPANPLSLCHQSIEVKPLNIEQDGREKQETANQEPH